VPITGKEKCLLGIKHAW